MFTHLVFIWLKEGTPAADKDSLLHDCREMLKEIPSLHLSAGTPAMTPREVVDNSYDVGLCTIFKDKAGHEAYQVHPAHKAFVAKHKQHWAKVIIYDFE